MQGAPASVNTWTPTHERDRGGQVECGLRPWQGHLHLHKLAPGKQGNNFFFFLRGKIRERRCERERDRNESAWVCVWYWSIIDSDMGQLIKSFPSTEYEIMIGHGSKAITKQHSHVAEQQHRVTDKDTLIGTNALQHLTHLAQILTWWLRKPLTFTHFIHLFCFVFQ